MKEMHEDGTLRVLLEGEGIIDEKKAWFFNFD